MPNVNFDLQASFTWVWRVRSVPNSEIFASKRQFIPFKDPSNWRQENRNPEVGDATTCVHALCLVYH